MSADVNPLTGIPHADADAVKRIHEAVTLEYVARGGDAIEGKWMAFRLADGVTNRDVYDSKDEAVRLMGAASQYCCYLRIPRGGVALRGVWVWLNFERQAYEAGRREDVGAPVIEVPTRRELWTPSGLKPIRKWRQS